MKISKIHLRNFKRFTDLLIDNIPSTSKLVLLIGSNGSGKSSLFDAFGFIDAAIKQDAANDDEFWNYFKKKNDLPVSVTIKYNDKSEYMVTDEDFAQPNLASTAFYGRTSFRQIPRLTRTSLGQGGQFNLQKDSDRPHYFIERDNRFENDVEKITEVILKDFFRLQQSNEQIRQKYINPINSALINIFGSGNGTKLQLIEIIPPLEGKVAQITFHKGDSEFHYNYLSAGEKEVFNLLINLLSRGSFYQDTIYFLDEIDLHLNTKLQYRLLKEITENWIPENCQLWSASHSLGFIEYAKQTDIASIIDFDDFDFDFPRVLLPEPKVTNYRGIVDRDFLSDDDIVQIRQHYPNLTILNYYSIENYLYHPDNLAEYYDSHNRVFDKEEYITQLTKEKNQIKDTFIPTIALKRTEYPYFGEPNHNGTALQHRFKNKQENATQSAIITAYLNSNDFETYYKSLPMKSYCTQLLQRQNISKTDLAKTEWFKTRIEELILTSEA